MDRGTQAERARGRGTTRAALSALLAAVTSAARPPHAVATTYYVRQTVGRDAHDGLSPETAWRHLSRLSSALRAGDTAYVGPGLYREELHVTAGGVGEAGPAVVADTTGRRTGDPPGVVLVTGAEPVDEGIFAPDVAPGVWSAPFATYAVLGVVEMDGDQRPYARARDLVEPGADRVAALGAVARAPASFFYDESTRRLHLHTSDGLVPSVHEIELVRRTTGISTVGRQGLTVVGFTLRHAALAGITLFNGAGDAIVVGIVSYGSHQGVHVDRSSRVALYANTFLLNDNSGIYFLSGSVGGLALGNVAYRNLKGIRLSSESGGAVLLDNTVFANEERGISIENADRVILRRNRLVRNARSQLLVIRSDYDSDDNCFDGGDPPALIADFFFPESDRFGMLADYQRAKRQDLHSRAGGCGPLPAEIDVHALHARSLAYAQRARKRLAGAARR